MVNQFRQLYVVKELDDNNTYVVDKSVKASNFSDKKANLYVNISGTMTALGSAYYEAKDVTSENFSTKKANLYTESGGTYSSAASGTYDSSETYYYSYNAAYVAGTVYYVKNTSLTNEEGEINWKATTDTIGKKIYFTYTGKGKDKNGNPTISRSPLIDPKNIVSMKAVNPAFLNKNKLIQTTNVGFAIDNSNLPNQVVIGINFTNFANGDSSIYPFTVSANKGTDASATIDNLVAAINGGKIVDLSGNQLVTASNGSTGGEYFLTITANACGSYELGMQDVYYPKFVVTDKMDENILAPQDTTFAVDTTSANGDVAAEMELLFMGERMQSGLPFNYPFNVNSKTMVDPTAAYSCLDIHYYIDNDKDFSQRSHGTITLLVKESAMNSVTLMNSMLGGTSGSPAGSSAAEGTLNKALATAGYSNLVLSNIS